MCDISLRVKMKATSELQLFRLGGGKFTVNSVETAAKLIHVKSLALSSNDLITIK